MQLEVTLLVPFIKQRVKLIKYIVYILFSFYFIITSNNLELLSIQISALQSEFGDYFEKYWWAWAISIKME